MASSTVVRNVPALLQVVRLENSLILLCHWSSGLLDRIRANPPVPALLARDSLSLIGPFALDRFVQEPSENTDAGPEPKLPPESYEALQAGFVYSSKQSRLVQSSGESRYQLIALNFSLSAYSNLSSN